MPGHRFEEIEQTLHALTSPLGTGGRLTRIQIAIDLNLDLREAREIFEREYLSRHLALSAV